MICEFALSQPCIAPYPHEHIHASMHRLRPLLEMLSRLAAGVGMPQTSEMLLYAADVADDEARLTPTGPLRQN